MEDGQTHAEEMDSRKRMVKDGTYRWSDFEGSVLEDKLQVLRTFFDFEEERGKAFLYRLLELIRNQNERINFARYVYLLARMEPDEKAVPERREAYRQFSRKMYQWIQNEKDRIELKTAITIYAYLTREKREDEGCENDQQ